MQTSTAPAAVASLPHRSRGWIRSPGWDLFWVLNTLWIAPLVWLAIQTDPDPMDSPVHTLYLVLTLCFWVGHRFSSTYLAYFTSAYRPLLKSQRARFVWTPICIAVAVFALLLPADDALPWPRSLRVMYLIILDYGLITYHFASQHFGFLSLYRVRAGQTRSVGARRLDRAYALVIGGLMVVVAELIAGTIFYQSVWLDPVFDPDWLGRVHARVQIGGTAIVALATAAMLYREVRDEHGSLPRALYLIGLGGMVTSAFFVTPFLFIVLWATQHWIAAMGVATVVARGDRPRAPSRWYGLWAAFSRSPWRLSLLLIAVSAILLPVMEVEALDEGEPGFADALVPSIADALSNSTWVPVLIALGFVTAFLHYTLDRAVFRLSDPDVRRAARGLFE